MQHYTSIEQSKKLVELGLNPDTADMWWTPLNWQLTEYYVEVKQDGINTPKNPLPCWSLGALLEVMPPYLFEFERGIDLNIYRNLNGKGWHVSYMSNTIEGMQKDKFRQITNGETSIDAAYNIVVWLLENGYIKKGK